MAARPSLRRVFQAMPARGRIKLTATHMNGIAVGLARVGGLSIPSSLALDATDERQRIFAACISLFSFGLRPYIHGRAKRWLKRWDG